MFGLPQFAQSMFAGLIRKMGPRSKSIVGSALVIKPQLYKHSRQLFIGKATIARR